MRQAITLGAVVSLALTVGLGSAASVSHGQEPSGYDKKLYSHLKWRNIGPNRGGRSQAVAGSSSRPLEYYFGATGGGVWKTTDAGTTWKPVSDEHFETSSVGAIAVAESNPDIVYVGMGETELRGNIAQGDGVYKSTDAGATWTRVGLEKTMAIARVRVHPENPDLVYVAALGNPFTPSEERGVFRSKDGGKSWERTLFRDEKTGAVDLVLDPSQPDTLYAALWEAYRTPHSMSSGGPGSGLFKSVDGGDEWTEITRNPGLPEGTIGKIGVAVSGADSKRVYAIVEANEGGVFRSEDGGATWKRVNEERKLRQRAFYYSRIYADPEERDTVYVLNTGLYRSTDGGETYKRIKVPHGDNHDLWIASNDPKRMVNANDGGGNVSFNGGETWTDQDFPTAQFYHTVTTKHVPYHVCGAQQDNSTACVPSDGDGDYLYDAGGGESGYIAPDPRNPDIFYAGTYGGHHTRLDVSTRQRRTINVWPENVMGHSSEDLKERFQWTAPILFSRVEPNWLYHGSQHLWWTTSEGQSWARISPDLTRADPETMGASGGPITKDQTGVETYATIFTIAPSYHDRDTIWTGSDDGLAHLTRDHGASWNEVTPPDLPAFTRISLIEASPHKPATAYLAGNRYQRGDRGPYVYRTDDYGETWTQIIHGLPENDFARAIREDPKRAGLLYLGTEHGVYVSFDDGAYWQSLRLDLPVTPVHDLIVEENDLVVGTHGRSFFVLDDIGVLRQLTPEVAQASFHLFEPAKAIKSIDKGVAVEYYLAQEASQVNIEFLDAGGQVIRSFESKPESEGEEEKEKEEGEEDEDEEDRPPPVTTQAGVNRFAWDTRYEGPTDFEGLILWWATTRGPKAPPGRFQVRVTADGVSQTRSFDIAKNPNSPASDADLQEQFRLALQIRDRFDQCNDSVLWIRAVKDQIQDRIDRAKDNRLAESGKALLASLTEIEGEIYQRKNQSNQDPLNYPVKLNNKFGVLQDVVESADSKPTASSYAVFEDLSRRLDEQISKLDRTVAGDLATFNEMLSSAGLERIDAGERPPTTE